MPPSPLSHAVPRAPPPPVQLHLVEMIKAKKSGAGHKMYKVCRRVLQAPIVKEDTYCFEVVGKELRGEGDVNAQGEWEGRGTMVYASGAMYEGQWRAGKRHGQGKFTYATGDMYEGGYVEDKRHGRGKYSYSFGDVYEGEYVKDKKHGRGKETRASGNSYEGEWADDKKARQGHVHLRQRRGEGRLLRGERRRGAGRPLECGPDKGVEAAGRRVLPVESHLAGQGGQDRRADRAAAA